MSKAQTDPKASNLSEALVPNEQKQQSYIINTGLLALCWAWTLSASTLFMFVCTISAKTICVDDGKDDDNCKHLSNSHATMTFGTYLIGAGLSSIPSDWIFKKMGRKGGFLFGCALQISGSIMGCLSMLFSNVPALFIGSIFVGLGQGFGQFYRFAAIETAPPDKKSWAVTFVLSGGILAAILGPTLAIPGEKWLTQNFLGSYIIMAILGCVNFCTVLIIKFDETNIKKPANSVRNPNAPTFWNVVSQPIYMLSVAIATIAQTIMIMLMSNVALEMQKRNFSNSNISIVFNLHFLFMYGPAFFTGKLIGKYGTFSIAFVGTVIYLFSLLVGVFSEELWAFYVSMIFLGLAWNLSFTAGTVMLTNCYPPEFTTACQGLNDVFVFGVSGVLSILSGIIVQQFGWDVQIYFAFCLLFLFIMMFFIAYNANLKGKDDAEETRRSSATSRTSVTRQEKPAENAPAMSAILEDDDGDQFDAEIYKPGTSPATTTRITTTSRRSNIRPSLSQGQQGRLTLTLTGGLARNTIGRASITQRFFTNEGLDDGVVEALLGEKAEDDSIFRASMGGF